MSDIDSTRLQLNDVEMRQSSVRQTPITSFGSIMRSGVNNTMNTVTNQAASAGYMIPGASVVGAAITGVGGVRDTSNTTGVGTVNGSGIGTGMNLTSTTPNASSVVSSGATSGTTTASSSLDSTLTGSSTANSNAALLSATQQMQEMNQQFNLQYLQLQEGMQAENRQFTALSNVMKTKNDTAKNSLSNLK